MLGALMGADGGALGVGVEVDELVRGNPTGGIGFVGKGGDVRDNPGGGFSVGVDGNELARGNRDGGKGFVVVEVFVLVGGLSPAGQKR